MNSPSRAMPVGSTRWVVTLAAMTTVTALSIDMSLPAQPTLARVFDVDDATAGLTLSVFLVGFAIAQLVVGYLSDAFGRRRVMLIGLGVFSAAAVACACAPSIEVLLACRVVQAIGASAPPVLARAMVRDTQPAQLAARHLSTMLATLAFAPMIAPTIGGAVLAVFGWRGIFATLALCGLILMALAHTKLAETLPPERRLTPSPRGLVRGFRTFFSTRGTRLPMLVSCAAFAGQFAYIADSPFIYMEGYGTSSQLFAIFFAITAIALMLGSIAGGRMLRAGRSPGTMIVLGTSILVVCGFAVIAGTRLAFGIAGFLIPMAVYFFGVGLASPSATALALEPVPQIAGTASAAIGCLTMISGAAAGYLTTKVGGSDPHAFAWVVAAMGAITAIVSAIAASLRRAQKQQESR